MLENYKYKYQSRGKFIYVPNDYCERRATKIIDFFRRVEFPAFFYHYAKGGHVAALHEHTKNDFFFRIDIRNFFYSIARNRVARVFSDWGLKGAPTYAKWSCVRNPYDEGPRYVVPIGFWQSPLVASLVLMKSPVFDAVERARERGAFISVYLDDFVGSHTDKSSLEKSYAEILAACVEANLTPNEHKLIEPAPEIQAFNCNLQRGSAEVTEARIAEFYSKFPSLAARQSFEGYVNRVSSANSRAL